MRNSLILVASAALAASGCGILYKQPIYQGNLIEQSQFEQLQPGMIKQQVLTLLGTPSVKDPFHNQRWDYVTSQRTGRTGRVETTDLTLYFDNDTLAKWEGKPFPVDDKALAQDVRKAFGPNLAKDKKKNRR